MASSLEPIVVQIVKSAEGTSTATGGGGGGVVGGVSKLTGIANMAQEGIAILSEGLNSILKPIRTLLVNAVKLIGQFLRPVADIIILLLQPILMLLKPIVKLFSLLMQPFRKIAYDLMKHAGQQKGGIFSSDGTALLLGAMSVMLQGLFGSMAVVIGKMIQIMIINPLIDILNFFTGGVFKDGLEELKTKIGTGIDDTTGKIYNTLLTNAKTTAQKFHDDLNLIDLDFSSWARAVGKQMEEDLVKYGLPKSNNSSSKPINYGASSNTSRGVQNFEEFVNEKFPLKGNNELPKSYDNTKQSKANFKDNRLLVNYGQQQSTWG